MTGAAMNVLIGGVGYYNLRDLSIGPYLVANLKKLAWPAGVEIDDLSFGPIAVVQRLEDRPGHFDRIILVSGAGRGRQSGQIYRYRWDGNLPSPAEIQQRVSEAVTGVISVDNLLILATYFKVLPSEVVVIEVEPADEGWGEGFSDPVGAMLEPLMELVRRSALEPIENLTNNPFASGVSS